MYSFNKKVFGLALLLSATGAMAEDAVTDLLVNPVMAFDVKLGPDNPVAIALNKALDLAPADEEQPVFGNLETKKGFLIEEGAEGGYLITCGTLYTPTRTPEPHASFKGCQIIKQAEAEAGVTVFDFHALLMKLGGLAILPLPHPEFCHTRLC